MQNRHIMVIEDDAATLSFVVDFLEMNDYEVLPWPTASQAIEQATQYQPDLVLLDHRLDLALSGWDILLTLCHQPATAHIPVILYSAESGFIHSVRDEVRSMHCDVLDKPFEPEILLAKLKP